MYHYLKNYKIRPWVFDKSSKNIKYDSYYKHFTYNSRQEVGEVLIKNRREQRRGIGKFISCELGQVWHIVTEVTSVFSHMCGCV